MGLWWGAPKWFDETAVELQRGRWKVDCLESFGRPHCQRKHDAGFVGRSTVDVWRI